MLTDILKQLPELGAADLEQVRARVQYLLQNGPDTSSVPAGLDPDTVLVLSVIQETMTAHGVDMSSFGMLQKAQQFKPMVQKVPGLIRYFKAGGIKERIEMRAILTTAVELLYHDLVKMGITVSSRTVMQHLHRIPATMMRHFPCYARMGYLSVIINRRKSS